jgi:transposase InsO family protein
MSQDIRQYVVSCITCQKRKAATSSKHLQQMIEPTHVYQHLHVDFLKASIKSADGHVYILVVVDARSGYVWLFPTKNKEAATVAEILYALFLDIGCVAERLLSDQGTEFVAAVIQDLCRLFSVDKVETSAYHPQANGVVERMNRRIMEILQAWVSETQRNWHKGLLIVQCHSWRATDRDGAVAILLHPRQRGVHPLPSAWRRGAQR